MKAAAGIAAALLCIASCDTKPAPQRQQPAPTETGDDSEAADNEAPRDAAAAVVITPDAAPPAPEAIDDPMKFVARERAEHKKHLPICPRGKGPCVAGFDFAYFVYDRNWKHYYVIDPGNPGNPIREGKPTTSQLVHRMSVAAAAVFQKEGKTKGLLRCDSAARFYELAGLDRYVTIDVSKRGAALPDGLEPMELVTPNRANELIAEMRNKINPTPVDNGGPLFSIEQISRMNSDDLENPRVIRGSQWVGSEDELNYAHFVVAFAPNSSKVYIAANVVSGEPDDVLSDKNMAALEKADLARVKVWIADNSVEHIQIGVSAMCELGPLGGYGAWLPLSLPAK